MYRNFKTARADAGITQADIAHKTGVTYQMVHQWEKGYAPIAKKHWSTLATMFHVTESELEEILIQTISDGCIEQGDLKMIFNAQKSRLYRNDLIFYALNECRLADERKRNTPENVSNVTFRYECELLERDKRIFELEKEVDELKKQLAELGKKPLSLSSALNLVEVDDGVKTTR
jgi:DNA-binding XRE family transcriptional regulator